MVTLATLDGSSLVPQLGGIQKRLDIQIQDEKEQAEVERLISAPDETAERASLLRLSQLDPAVSASVQAVLKRRDDQEIAALQNQTNQAFKFSTFLGGIKNFATQSNEIDKRITQLQGEEGDNSARIQNLLKLQNMTKEQREIAILKTKTLTADVKTAVEADKARKALEIKNQEKRFLQNALTAQQIQASPGINQGALLEDQALREDKKGNAQGAQVWRQIAGIQDPAQRNQALQQIENLATTKLTPTKPIEPKGDLAVANQQLAAGNITQDQFDLVVSNVKAAQKTGLMKDLISAGVKFDENGVALTKEGRQLIKDIRLKPQVSIINAPKLEPGMAPNNPGAWAKGDTTDGVHVIKGSLKGEVAPEKAAKISQIQTAIIATGKPGEINGIDGLLYQTKDKLGPDGKPLLDKRGQPQQEFDFDERGNLKPDRVNIAQSIFGQGRDLDQLYENGIQAVTRGETGAAMPAEEVENTRIRFKPKLFDSDAMVDTKIRLFRSFLNGAMKLIDPTGRFSKDTVSLLKPDGSFDEKKFNDEIDKRMGNKPRTKAEQEALKGGKVGKFTFTVEP